VTTPLNPMTTTLCGRNTVFTIGLVRIRGHQTDPRDQKRPKQFKKRPVTTSVNAKFE